MLETAYASDNLNDYELTRAVEGFFKTCRELADWIQEATGRGAREYVHEIREENPSALKLCDAVAQTAKHYIRKPEPNLITASVP